MTGSQRTPPQATDGRTPLWRSHNVFRVVTFLWALFWFGAQFNQYQRPWLATVCICGMAIWTAFTVWRYWSRPGRTNRLVLADVVVVNGLFGINELILTEHQQLIGDPSVVTVWHSTAVTAAAVQWGAPGGVISGVIATVGNYLLRGHGGSSMAMDALLLVGVGLVIGLAANTARTSTERLARAMQAEAATAERERLARSIHDSVLQVLARVRQRGSELGGEAAQLAEMAGEQEIALRSLIATTPETSDDDEADLAVQLQRVRTAKVHVSVPGNPVRLPKPRVADLFAAVREALVNVDKHAPGAQAWVLLEELPEEIVLSVRDNGPGIPEGRLSAAAEEGRLGVAKSIRGRVESMGGKIILDTAPGEGTEWELRVPRETAPSAKRRRGGVR